MSTVSGVSKLPPITVEAKYTERVRQLGWIASRVRWGFDDWDCSKLGSRVSNTKLLSSIRLPSVVDAAGISLGVPLMLVARMKEVATSAEFCNPYRELLSWREFLELCNIVIDSPPNEQ